MWFWSRFILWQSNEYRAHYWWVLRAGCVAWEKSQQGKELQRLRQQ